MREAEVPRINTVKELTSYIRKLTKQKHDYGTCVYAMSMSAQAAFNYVAHCLGVTGFQASCADMDFLRRTRRLKHGFRFIDYSNLLYPQYLNSEHFPSIWQLIEENKKRLSEAAKKLLKESPSAHPDVIAHWKMLSELKAAPAGNQGNGQTQPTTALAQKPAKRIRKRTGLRA